MYCILVTNSDTDTVLIYMMTTVLRVNLNGFNLLLFILLFYYIIYNADYILKLVLDYT